MPPVTGWPVEGQFRVRATDHFTSETRINLQKDTRMATSRS